MPADSSVRVRLLKHPSDEQIEEATALAVRAFGWREVEIALTGNNPSLQPQLFRMQFGAARVAGEMYVVMPQDSDKILAAGLWFGPGTKMMRTEEQRAAGFNQFIEMLDPVTKHWWLVEYPQATLAADKAYGKDVVLNSWYANLIATDPEHQGKGYGSLMVHAGLKRGVEDQAVVALATSSRPLVGWYKHLGFEEVIFVEIEGPKINPRTVIKVTWFRCDDPEKHL